MSKGVKPPKVIAILSSKGGVGKTTIATHVAGALHLNGARVLVLDLDDEQGSAAAWAASRGPDSPLAGLPVLLQDRPLTPERYAKVLHQAQQGGPVEYVILDGPPRLSEQAKAAARLADLVVIPVRAEQLALWALDKTWRLLDEARQRPPAARLLVLTQAKRRARLTDAAATALLSIPGTVGTPVILHESVRYGMATMRGETVASETSTAADELEWLIRRIMEALGADRGASRGAVQHG